MRPTIAEVSAHHWIAPFIFRVPTTVGVIPCTARPPRPLSVTRPEDLAQPESLRPLFTTRRRSPSPFQARDQAVAVFRWQPESTGPAQLPVLDPRVDVTSVGLDANTVAAVESSGQVVLWEGGAAPRHLSGTPGITVVRVAVGETFLCLLTDRGILLTRGRGSGGCLGHGDTRDVSTPRIVEALLGEDVVEVEAGPQHAAVVTSDGELFSWGQDTGGCLGTSNLNRLSPLPQLVEIEEEVSRVFCGPAATVLLTLDGGVLVAGRNRGNMLGLDTEDTKVKQSDQFQRVMEEAEPVEEVGLSDLSMVLLTKAGHVWTLGGESRMPKRLNLSSPGRPILVAASAAYIIVAMEEGSVVQVLVHIHFVRTPLYFLWTLGQMGWQGGAGGDVDLGRTRLTREKSGQGGRLSGCPRCSPADELRFTKSVL